MSDKILERFRQLGVKFKEVDSFRFEHRIEGIILHFKIGNFERPELFTNTSEDLLRDLVYQTWPNLVPNAEQGALTIRRNAQFLSFAAHMEEADQYLRNAATSDFEAIYTILDANGQLIARYVSKMDGIVMRLEG